MVTNKDTVPPAGDDALKKKASEDEGKTEKDGTKPTNGKDKKTEVELSEEDVALKENLELMVMRASDPKAGVAKLALETMRSEIRTATRYVTVRSQLLVRL
jgi:26S proteasome regulatory subunit N1